MMLDIVIVSGVMLLIFLCMYLVFVSVLRIGMKMGKGIEPPVIKSPVRLIKEAAERKKTEEKADAEADYMRQMDELDGYTDAERALVYKGGEK